MIKWINLYMTLVALQIGCIQAQEISYYTSTKIGDQITIAPSDSTVFNLLIFLNENSCNVCTSSIDPIIRSLGNMGRTNTSIFVATQDTRLPSILANKYGWSARVEGDPMLAYQKLFGIINPPLGIVADSKGRVLEIGPIGTSTFDWSLAFKRLRGQIEVHPKPHTPNLPIVSRVHLDSSDVLLVGGAQRQAVLIGRDKFVLCSTPLQTLYSYSLDGGLHRTLNLNKAKSYTPVIPILATAPLSTTTLLIVDQDPTSYELVALRLSTDLEPIEYSKPGYVCDTLTRPTFFFSTDVEGNMLVSGIGSDEPSATDLRKVGPVVWSRHNDTPIILDHRSWMFNEADISNYYWVCSAIKGDTIYAIENMSDTVIVYNLRTGNRERIPFMLDTTSWRSGWKSRYKSINTSSSLEDRKALVPHTSCHEKLLVDASNGEIYLTYYNSRSGSPLESYVVGPIGKASSSTRRLGFGMQSHAVSEGRLYCTQIFDGGLDLVVLRL